MERTLTKAVGSKWALLSLLAYSVAWFVIEGANIGWDGFATIAGLAVVFIIQRSQNRDTTQMITLLDTLIIAVPDAANELAHLDEADIGRIEALKRRYVKKSV